MGVRKQKQITYTPQEQEWLSPLTPREQNDLIHFALCMVGEKVGWKVPPGRVYGIMAAYVNGMTNEELTDKQSFIKSEVPVQQKPMAESKPREEDPYTATNDKYRPDIANAIQASLHQFRDIQKKEN